jgi:hypothetical protein
MAIRTNDLAASTSASDTLRCQSSNISGHHAVGDIDAQDIYPPAACIFVAK